MHNLYRFNWTQFWNFAFTWSNKNYGRMTSNDASFWLEHGYRRFTKSCFAVSSLFCEWIHQKRLGVAAAARSRTSRRCMAPFICYKENLMVFDSLFVNDLPMPQPPQSFHGAFLWSYQMAQNSFLSPCFAVSAVSASDQVFSRSAILHFKPCLTGSKPPLQLGWWNRIWPSLRIDIPHPVKSSVKIFKRTWEVTLDSWHTLRTLSAM